MARVNLNDADKYTEGGSVFFKLDNGQSAKVRFLYNTIDEIESSALLVHEFGDYQNRNFATIDCGRIPDDPNSSCKWCESGNKPVVRVVIPMYNLEEGCIQYWKKSGKWVNDTVMELFRNLPNNMPISGQVFNITRRGEKLETVYTVAPVMSMPNDMKTKDQFGEIQDGYALNIIRPTNFEYDPNAQVTAQQGNSQSFGQSTRRTVPTANQF